jgi:ribosomal protein S18 acetylase RimI-like enzyme
LAYFIESAIDPDIEQEGTCIVRMRGEKAVAFLLLNYESEEIWWMESIYVLAEERKMGHLSVMFKEAMRLAKEKKIIQIKLYVETSNYKAQTTYKKLGMTVLKEKMHTYDFVLGNVKLENKKSIYEV